MSDTALGRFDHHPNPAIDFCVEVEEIEGEAYNLRVGFQPMTKADLLERIDRAMHFIVGGDIGAIVAKDRLREIEREVERLPGGPHER